MELSTQEQIIELLKKKGKILLASHIKPDGDTVSSALALALILKKIGREDVVVHCADPLPEVFDFLPATQLFVQKSVFPKDFVISLNCAEIEVEKLRWRREDDKLNILISPKTGEINPEKVSFGFSQNVFSLIITLDAADREQLGALFAENTKMFTETPLINIDHHISNTNFGLVNFVDGTAASTTEVLYSLVEPLEKAFGVKIMDEEIATLLLTGIITDTGSFQNPNTTPRSFETAAELIERGARQQDIIRKLFKTKNLSTLKLWGRVLSKIKNDPVHRFVWSTVSAQDLKESGATSNELTGILDDLLSSAPGAEVVLLLKEREDGVVAGSLRTTSSLVDAVEISEMFGGGGHRQATGFKIPRKERDFAAITAEVIKKIQDYQARRLGIARSGGEPISATAKPVEKMPAKESKKEKILDFSFDAPKKAVDLTEKLHEAGEVVAEVKKAVAGFNINAPRTARVAASPAKAAFLKPASPSAIGASSAAQTRPTGNTVGGASGRRDAGAVAGGVIKRKRNNRRRPPLRPRDDGGMPKNQGNKEKA